MEHPDTVKSTQATKPVRVIGLIPGEVRTLPAVAAADLRPDVFWNEYVYRHKPVLIKGAVQHWPAIARWKDPAYLDSISEDEVEYGRTFNAIPPDFFFDLLKKARLSEVLGLMRAAGDDETWTIPTFPVPARWEQDLGSYPFLAAEKDQPPRVYQRRRLFVYKNASTEWHGHVFDETLTTQLLGTKRFSLFKLTEQNCKQYMKPMESNYHHMACGADFFPKDKPVVKLEGTLETGDALYIPPSWVHGIDPADAQVGITLAHCFRSPATRIATWREPFLRHSFASVLLRPPFIAVPMGAALVAYSGLARLVKREPWNPASELGE